MTCIFCFVMCILQISYFKQFRKSLIYRILFQRGRIRFRLKFSLNFHKVFGLYGFLSYICGRISKRKKLNHYENQFCNYSQRALDKQNPQGWNSSSNVMHPLQRTVINLHHHLLQTKGLGQQEPMPQEVIPQCFSIECNSC